MAARRPPRPGTKTALVFAQLQGEDPHPPSATIAQRTGLSLREVRNARARVYVHHHLPTPSREEVRAMLRSTRGTLWPQIRRYAEMGMTPREMQLALQLEHGTSMEYARVENALNKAWKQGLVPRRTPSERRASRLEALHHHEGELRAHIADWLEVAAQIASGIRTEQPQTRAQWLALVAAEEQQHRGNGAPFGSHWQILARLCAHSGVFLSANDPQLVAQLRAADAARLEALLDGKRELLPPDVAGQSYLLDLYLARRQWAETGDRRAVDAFPSFYEESEPDIASRLAPAIAYLRSRTPAAPVRAARPAAVAMVEYADVSLD